MALNFQPLSLSFTILLISLNSVICGGGSGRLSVQQEIRQAANRKAEDLNLSNRGLTTLPHDIRQLTDLKVLRLNGNTLTELSPKIGQLTHLTELYLSDNQLSALPPEVGQLTHLHNNFRTQVANIHGGAE